jgi:hypothetical protein
MAGDAPGPRVGHAAAVFNHYVYVVGGQEMGGKRVDSYRIDLSRSPYVWELLPQTGEPPRLEFAGCASVASFGLLLFGGREGHRRLWRLPLDSAAEDAAPAAVDAEQSVVNRSQSSPLFSVRMRTVRTGIGTQVPPPLDFSVDAERLNRITKQKGGMRRWRKNAIVSITSQPLNGVDDGGQLLCDSDFRLPRRKRAIEITTLSTTFEFHQQSPVFGTAESGGNETANAVRAHPFFIPEPPVTETMNTSDRIAETSEEQSDPSSDTANRVEFDCSPDDDLSDIDSMTTLDGE